MAFCHAQAQDRDSVPVPVAVASVRFDGTAARTSVASHVGTSSRRREQVLLHLRMRPVAQKDFLRAGTEHLT